MQKQINQIGRGRKRNEKRHKERQRGRDGM